MLRDLNLLTISLRILLALFVGGVIGLERGSKNQPAGFRTYMLVCLGAALVMMTNQYICDYFGGGDPSRLGAQVVSGIGFLGAGTIIVTVKNQVRGLTTAAGLWSAACLGLAIGIGFYEGAVLAGGSILLVMTLLAKVEYRIKEKSRYFRLYTNFLSSDAMNDFIDSCKALEMMVVDIQITKAKRGVVAFITLKSKIRCVHSEMLQKMSESTGLKHIEEI